MGPCVHVIIIAYCAIGVHVHEGPKHVFSYGSPYIVLNLMFG